MCGKFLFTSIIFAEVIANKSFSKGTLKKKIERTFETPVLFHQILSYQKSPSRLCEGERKVAAVERKNNRVTKLAVGDWLLCLHSLQPANSSLMAQGEPYMLDRNHDKSVYFIIEQLLSIKYTSNAF